MTPQPPTPAPELAMIITAAREFAKAQRFGESCCWCPGELRCHEAIDGKLCPSFDAIIAAASRCAAAEAQVSDLAMIARRLMVGCDAKQSTIAQALDYLKRHGLAGSPVRANAAPDPIPTPGCGGEEGR